MPGFQDCEDLCLKLIDMLEQDSPALAKSLEGDIMAVYDQLIQEELERMRRLRKLIAQARDAIN